MIQFFKALADENRLRIINLLMHSELCVCEIEVMLEMTQSNVSRHLNKLKSAGIISSSKDAQWVHYKTSAKFEMKNELLFTYLKNEFGASNLFLDDLARYKRYEEQNLNCQLIREDKEKVLKLIK
ncbi:metalloregulator ArsR/SmtB family transcription factor [Clostridium sediminicola]|uniref:ArsR/SmtB family transcription factor n=1 Tax=Clostridium sediminicola TaxID=3114879 RepID=UPI0031F1DBFC